MTGMEILAFLSAPATLAAASALFKAGRLTQKVNGLETQFSNMGKQLGEQIDKVDRKCDRLIERLLNER